MSSFKNIESKIALIEIKGVITESRDIIREIKRYNDDASIKAILLRIDSPGGVVGPAQEIYTELNKVDKNIVTSMGSVAASGGYYIACASDTIFANPGTITGSIGVVMSFPQMQELSKKIGIGMVVVKSGKYKDSGSSFREMTPDERQVYQSMVDDVHEQFVEAVYEGRKHANLTKEKILEIADGRAFSGRQALKMNLIDNIGTLNDAIEYTAKISGIKGEPKVIKKRERKPLINRFLGNIFGDKINNILDKQISIRYELSF
jgi:protease-4